MHLKDCLYRSIPCVFQFTSVCSEKVIYKNWYDHAQSHVLWKTFKFMVEAEIADEVASDIDPDWVPPKDMDEGSDDDSDISEDEVKELLESKDKELDEVLKDQAKVPDAAEEELPAKIESLKITEEVTKVAPAAAVAEAQVTSTTS